MVGKRKRKRANKERNERIGGQDIPFLELRDIEGRREFRQGERHEEEGVEALDIAGLQGDHLQAPHHRLRFLRAFFHHIIEEEVCVVTWKYQYYDLMNTFPYYLRNSLALKNLVAPIS